MLDVDETALDNSTYSLERASYGLPWDADSWAAWVDRRQAPPLPGVREFVARVHRAGGHVAWITNRSATLTEPTRDNLKTAALWSDDDRLCPQKDAQDPKANRRREVVTGAGDCAWSGRPMVIVALVGDQMGDFPDASEAIPGTGSDDAFGLSCFLLPNAMYGDWTMKVTRRR